MELTNNRTGQVLALADYEARIHLYKEQIGTGYIGIGRTLIEAKKAEVVPHGEWESWATATTGLNISAVQRCMKAAREIKDGSALAELEMSKALMLLTSGLGEDQQEHLARHAVEESATVKELRAEIEATKAEISKAARDRDNLVQLTKSQNQELEKMERAAASRDATIKTMKQQLKDAKASVASSDDVTAKALEEIDELRADLAAAEEREARKSEQLAALRKEQTQRAMEDARGLSTSALSGFDLAAAVRAFIGSAGVLPQMGSTLAGASPAERETIRQNIETVAKWVDGARAALDVVAVDVTGLETA